MLFNNSYINHDNNEYDPYKELALAVVTLAVEDYIKAMHNKNKIAMRDLEEFFKSDLYSALIDVDGEHLLNMLRKKYNIDSEEMASYKKKQNYILTFKDLKEFYYERLY